MTHLQISAGRDRSIALGTDGSAFGWGGIKRAVASLPADYPGELCTSGPTEIGHNRYAEPVPQRLNPGQSFAFIADGHTHAIAVRRSGDVLALRPVLSSKYGAQQEAITPLPGAPRQVALTESAAFAVYDNGTVWAWGMRSNGQLGRAAFELHAPPAAIKGLPAVAAVATGHAHVLALDRNGCVWTWGANAAGQLGVGDLKERPTPNKVTLPVRIKRVAAGDTHSLAIDEAGQLWAWGSNNFGQLGSATSASPLLGRFAATPVRVRTGFAVAQLDAGMFYTVATSAQGDVFAWGWNGMGQLGADGLGLAASAQPVRIKPLSGVTRIAAGQAHVLAVTPAGVVAWGDNRSAACGMATSIAVQLKPVPIALDSREFA